MSLSRKHYQAIAAELREERQEVAAMQKEYGGSLSAKAGTLRTISRIEDRLCAYFQADNPNFRPDTFRKAATP